MSKTQNNAHKINIPKQFKKNSVTSVKSTGNIKFMPKRLKAGMYETEDPSNFIINDIQFEKDETILMFGREIEKNTLYIKLFGIVIVVIIWYLLGIFKYLKSDIVLQFIFLAFILLTFMSIYSSSFLSGSISLETAKLINIEQNNVSMIGNIIFLFILIEYFYNKHSSDKYNHIAYSILILLLINNLRFNLKPHGGSIKAIKELKETILNVVIFTTITYMYLQLFKKNQVNARNLNSEINISHRNPPVKSVLWNIV